MPREEDVDAQNYAALAVVYNRARPSYPGALVDILVRHAGVEAGDAVAEIGAGTGRFTRLLAERRLSIAALEPVAEMRAQAPSLGGVTWSDGTFERTGLADQSQRWVVSAQAFHWAQARVVLPEIRRILMRQGWFTVLWNAHHIAREPVLAHTYALMRRHIPAYRYTDRTTRRRRWSSRLLGAAPDAAQHALGRLAGALGAGNWVGRGLQLLSTRDFGALVYHEVAHDVRVSREIYLDLWRSRNHLRSIAGPRAFEAFVSELSDYLESSKIDDVTVPYICGAWSAQVRHHRGG